MLEVDPGAFPRDAYCRRQYLDLRSFPHKSQDALAIVAILVGKSQDLSRIEEAVFFSHKHDLIFNLDLDMPRVKIGYLDEDRSACVPRLTGSSRTVYLSFPLVHVVQIPCQYCSHLMLSIAR